MAGLCAGALPTTCFMVRLFYASDVKGLLLLLFLAAAAHGQTVVWTKGDPMAGRGNRTGDVTRALQTSGVAPAVRLDYSSGGSIALTQSSPGLWQAAVPAAKVLDDYKADDVNHNVVGFVRLLGSSGQTLSTLNSIVQVVDDR